MRVKDQFQLAFRAMTNRKLRTVLTIIGIVIGPATIVSLDAATLGYSNANTAQFAKLGATTLFVSPVGRGFTLSDSDLGNIQSLAGVSAAVPYQELTGTITQGKNYTISVEIIAINLTQLSLVFPSLSIYNGSLPLATDLNSAIIGYSVAFPNLSGALNVSINQVISVSSLGGGAAGFGPQSSSSGRSSTASSASAKSFLVSGIFNYFGQGLFLNPDTAIFIPLSSGEVLLHTETYSGVIVVASDLSEVTPVDTELTALYGQDVRITTVDSLISTIQNVSQSTGTLLASVGSISVLVAFIAIMTTEFTSVLERTKEIGILKALGANSRTILFNFISESLVTGFLGGVIGAGIGSALSFVVIGFLQGSTAGLSLTGGGSSGSRATSGGGGSGGASSFSGGSIASRGATTPSTTSVAITPSLTPELLLLAIALATVVGGLAGLLPAWRASRLTPVDALREA